MEVNMEKLKPTNKKISQMKEMIYNNSNKKIEKPSTSNQIIVNQNHQPSFNSINIYTTAATNTSSIKNDQSLRNYIFNKISKKKGHVRSISNI
jgi:hypothetical protein